MKYILICTLSICLVMSFCTNSAKNGLSENLDQLKNSFQKLDTSLKKPLAHPVAEPIVKPGPFATHGLIMILDDSQIIDEFDVECSDLLQALIQESYPILTSASLIDGVKPIEHPAEKDPKKILELFNKIKNPDSSIIVTTEEQEEIRKAILSIWSLNDETAKNYVIKEINSSLYLIVPKKYLNSKGINVKDVEVFNTSGPISQIELTLGLKVNHCKTVHVADIKKPTPAPEFSNYFIDYLSKIFVTNHEYPAAKKGEIANWTIDLTGPGDINHSVANLNLTQFKELLEFLATKITTKLFFYTSCYAAGVNSEILYKDAQAAVDKTYPFVIMTQALTDAAVKGDYLELELHEGKLRIKPIRNFTNFFNTVTSTDYIDYTKLLPFLSTIEQVKGSAALTNLAQIRFPGLPWFSVIDADKVVNIGAILSKTRTEPLDVATFFARKGKNAEPLGILLYGENVPFELIINTKQMPAIISMIPDNAVHHIKKISSTAHTLKNIFDSFFTLDTLAPTKIFFIDELSAPFDELFSKELKDKQGPLRNVLIRTSEWFSAIYFTYKDIHYEAFIQAEMVSGILTFHYVITVLDEINKEKYKNYLAKYENRLTIRLPEIQETAQKLFAKKLTNGGAADNIIYLLDMMPQNSLLRIPVITCLEEDYAHFPINDLINYRSEGTHKILWIDTIEKIREQNPVFIEFTNFIIDVPKVGVTRLFYTDNLGEHNLFTRLSSDILEQDYLPLYQKVFTYYQTHQKFDESLEKEIDSIYKHVDK